MHREKCLQDRYSACDVEREALAEPPPCVCLHMACLGDSGLESMSGGNGVACV